VTVLCARWRGYLTLSLPPDTHRSGSSAATDVTASACMGPCCWTARTGPVSSAEPPALQRQRDSGRKAAVTVPVETEVWEMSLLPGLESDNVCP